MDEELFIVSYHENSILSFDKIIRGNESRSGFGNDFMAVHEKSGHSEANLHQQMNINSKIR